MIDVQTTVQTATQAAQAVQPYFDKTIHLGDVIMGAGALIGGWRFAWQVRDTVRDMRKTMYGSIEPPVEGLVAAVKRHDLFITDVASITPSRHR